MKYLLLLLTVTVVSGNVFASVACEKTLTDHFKKNKINPSEIRDVHDYSNPRFEPIAKKLYSAGFRKEFDGLAKEADKYKVKDSRANEIIRVCSAISAYARAGVPGKDIETMALNFQNEWSEAMKSPLKALIKEEVAALGKVSSKLAGRDTSFCTPDHSESTCSSADGRVYKLQNNVNQLQRGLIIDKGAVPSFGGNGKKSIQK